MTFSILALDQGTGAIGGAAATGSLCVGGWVLRGDSRVGLSASQGAAPSTLWGEDVLALMAQGAGATEAVARITGADGGRAWRQLSALDRRGGTACHTGDSNSPWHGSIAAPGLVVAGNLLAGPEVLEALLDGFLAARGLLAERLSEALLAAKGVGGDRRGLLSAALLVLSDETPPLSLRVDWSEDPLRDLRNLYARSQSGEYAAWLPIVPTRNDPERYSENQG